MIIVKFRKFSGWESLKVRPSQGVEPYDGKLSRTVLRRDWGGNTPVLPGLYQL